MQGKGKHTHLRSLCVNLTRKLFAIWPFVKPAFNFCSTDLNNAKVQRSQAEPESKQETKASDVFLYRIYPLQIEYKVIGENRRPNYNSAIIEIIRTYVKRKKGEYSPWISPF